MMETFDLIIIGAGPGGYIAAIRAAQLGLKVAIVDKSKTAGGTCLNIGCIPSKALLHSSQLYWEAKHTLAGHGIECQDVHLDLQQFMKRKETVVEELIKGLAFLFRKNKITFINGQARFNASQEIVIDQTSYQARHILIATGATPSIPDGIEIDEEQIVTSTGALSLKKVPDHLVVIGGGYIGLELGSVWARLGSKVTVIEYFDKAASTLDDDLSRALQKTLTDQGFVFQFNTKLTKIEKGKDIQVHFSSTQGEGEAGILACDVVLLAMGRRPYTKNLGLETIGIQVDERGFIPVNQRWQTIIPNIYAIGDVTPGAMLAHRAEEEGIAVAEQLAGQTGHVDYDVIPAVVYTSPEVASVGKTEQQLKAANVNYKVGKFPFSANSRAKAVGDTQGFVKVLTDAHTDRILGVHIIGELAGTMIAEAALAMAFGGSAEDIARTCHAHPTHSEALKEASFAAFSQALQI